MNIRSVKRLCMVKGCGNRDSYSLSVSSEFGQSVIICADCLNGAQDAILKLKNGVKVYKEDVEKTEAPSLFFHPSSTVKKVEPVVEPVVEEPKPEEDDKKERSSDDVVENGETDEEKTSTSQDFVCPKCGKVYKSQSAFERHILVCKG